MATRSVAWRRCCPDAVSRCLDESARVTLYIVHQIGPTGFILKQEGVRKKVKVLLGDPHMCSCSAFKKTHELCVHIVWVLLKKFRIPRANPVVWQLGLIQREITEILRGFLTQQAPSSPRQASPSHPLHTPVTQKEIGPDDVCPICQDDLLDASCRRRVTYCQFGCGKSVHIKCIKIWAEHQRKATPTNETKPLPCPLCRGDFGSIPSPTDTRHSHLEVQRQHSHLGVACHHCHVCPIVGKCYQCCICASYHLCHACFSNNQIHPFHSFLFRQHSDQPWRPVPPPSSATAPASASINHTPIPAPWVSSLQSRSLTEQDYDLLLSLDTPPQRSQPLGDSGAAERSRPRREGVAVRSQFHREDAGERSRPHGEGVSGRVITGLHVEPLDGHHPMVVGGACCQLCGRGYVRGDWIKKLPCKHKFHRACVDEWLRDHSTCPVDDHPVAPPPNNGTHHAHNTATTMKSSAVKGLLRTVAPLTRARLAGGAATQSCTLNSGAGWGSGTSISIAGKRIGEELPAKHQTSSRSLPSLFKTTPSNDTPSIGIMPPRHLPLSATIPLAVGPLGVGVGGPGQPTNKMSGGRLRKGTILSGGGARGGVIRPSKMVIDNSLQVSRFHAHLSGLT